MTAASIASVTIDGKQGYHDMGFRLAGLFLSTPPKHAAEPRDRPRLPCDLEPPKGLRLGLE